MSVETAVEATEPVITGNTIEPAADVPVVEAAETPAQEREPDGKFRRPVQPRIDELTRKARENEREAAFWRARAEAAEKPPAPPPEKPTPEKFDDYGAYVEALTEFKADEKVKAALDTREKAATEKRETETRQSTWQTRKAEAAKAIPDLDSVLQSSDVPVANHVSVELLDSEFGPQIAYKLANDRELAEKLNAMTPTQAAREIGRLEAGYVSAPAAVEPEPEPVPVVEVKTTKAPPPVKPIGQGRSTAVDLSKASMDDYVAARKAQGASWARR